jgi:hypothetical protein
MSPTQEKAGWRWNQLILQDMNASGRLPQQLHAGLILFFLTPTFVLL